MVANLEKELFKLSAQNDIPSNLLKYYTRAMNHPVSYDLQY
jgi:hypothetical protein